MERFGLIRVAVASPRVQIADPRANAEQILDLVGRAIAEQVDVAVFPELCLTGYTAADLFHQRTLLDAAKSALDHLASQTKSWTGMLAVGLPWELDGRLYNVAAILHWGHLLALVPKTHLPNYKEFYEKRWFTPWSGETGRTVFHGPAEVPFGTDVLLEGADVPGLLVGVELCEDLWVPVPPSCHAALAGATLVLNLSASNEGAGKADYRRELILNQSGRCLAAYAYAASGVTESTTDLVFGGHSMIAESAQLLAEASRFSRESQVMIADVDIERLLADRARMTTFQPAANEGVKAYRRIPFTLPPVQSGRGLRRPIAARPFVPADPSRRHDRCQEIFETQAAGLAKRLEVARPERVHLGISGGLDSTLALLVTVKCVDRLEWPRDRILGITMPGFGTSPRTLDNAERLMTQLGIRAERIDIRPLCLETFRELGHRPFGIELGGLTVKTLQDQFLLVPAAELRDLVFENVQARIRTLLLMSRGFVVSTGDLSELALGWCTYNADHMGMYNPNASIPKTLVRYLVEYAADEEFSGPTRETLHSIAATDISPELLPLGPENQVQNTEATIGPYELHDFFLFYCLRFGFSPRKIRFLAEHTRFGREVSREEIGRWLRVFYQRFFQSQFKRSCLPDGPKVGSVSLSPRGDWRMPSDAVANAWLAELD